MSSIGMSSIIADDVGGVFVAQFLGDGLRVAGLQQARISLVVTSVVTVSFIGHAPKLGPRARRDPTGSGAQPVRPD
jgi:hypothetical protein